MSQQRHSQQDTNAAVQGVRPPPVMSIFDFSAEALGELKTWLEQNPPSIPITQVIGYSQQTAQAAPYIAVTETTTGTSFGDLATVGPQLTALPDGVYLVFYGCAAACATGDEADMGVQSNSDAIDGQSSIVTLTTTFTSISGAVQKTLNAGGNNTLTAKYLSLKGGTASFGRRYLIALKISNA